jgi:renalase
MSTRRGDGWQCDHGAQYFTARDPGFRAEVARWEQHGVAALWNPRVHVFNGELLAPVDGAGDVSLGAVDRFVGTPRMTSPARFLADKVPARFETTIMQLDHREAGWCLSSVEHGWLDEVFDAVLLAMPSPQVVPVMQAVAPDLAALAASARMRGSWALMLRFAEPVAWAFDAAFVNAGPLRWIARDSSKPGRGGPETWLLHASAEWSEAHIEETADHVGTALLAAFGQLGGPAPQHWTAHRWRYADTEPVLDLGCVWQEARGLGLCGDWLHGGKVEGAWLSGQALARQVAESMPGSAA